MIVRRAGTLLSLALLSCGGGIAPAFDLRFPDNDPEQLARARSALQQSQAARDAAPLWLATTHGAEPMLMVYDLAQGKLRWQRAAELDSRPQHVDGVVVARAGAALLAFDAADGALRHRVPLTQPSYLGASGAGGRVFAVESGADELGVRAARSRVFAFDAESGRVLWERRAAAALGRPLALGQAVLVPWERQALSVLDAATGRELARLRSHDDVLEWVAMYDGEVYYGDRAIHRLRTSATPSRGDEVLRPRLPELPGRPVLQRSAYATAPARRSAHGRIGLHYRLEPHGQSAALVDERAYLLFYRHVFAFEAGQLRWAKALDEDGIAARAVPSGLLVATEAGRLWWLSAESGVRRELAALGRELASARLDDWRQAGGEGGERAPPREAEARAPREQSLRADLVRLALDPDNRLVPSRAFAIEALAELSAPEVTRDLLDIYRQSATPPELKQRISQALRTRRTGIEHLVDALLARYDFLEQSRPAPLSVIVPALVEARETRAVPRLIERMNDHETPLSVLPTVVHAIVELGDGTVVPPLLDFLRLYRSDSSFASDPEALLAAAAGVMRHGGPEQREMLAELARAPDTSPPLAAGLRAALQPSAVEREAALARRSRSNATAKAAPETLSQRAVNATFARHIDDTRSCVIEELGRNPKLAQVRIAFIAEGDGTAHAWTFAPNTPEFVDCLYPKVRDYRFPRFSRSRQVARYVVAVRPDVEEADTKSAEPESAEGAQPFWAAAKRAAPDRLHGEGAPWWQSRQPLAPLSEPRAPSPSAESEPESKPQSESEPQSEPEPRSGDQWWLPAR